MQIAVPRWGFTLKICNVNSRPKESPDTEKLNQNPRIVHLQIITIYSKCSSSRGSLVFLYLGPPQGNNFSFQISIKIVLSLRVFLKWIFLQSGPLFFFCSKNCLFSRLFFKNAGGGWFTGEVEPKFSRTLCGLLGHSCSLFSRALFLLSRVYIIQNLLREKRLFSVTLGCSALFLGIFNFLAQNFLIFFGQI